MVPYDGVRRQIRFLTPVQFSVELEQDGFRKDYPVTLKKTNELAFVIENRSGKPHHTRMTLEGKLPEGKYTVIARQKEVKDFSETEKVLEVKDLSAKGFEHINFDLHAGEILGIAGQLGSGRTELSLALFGMLKPTGGSICISGKEVKLKNVAEAQKQGIALVPEDRLTEGLFLPQPIYKNIAVTSLKELSGALGSVKESAQKELSEHWVKEIGVATKDHTLPVQTLSGGNQQKVVLARWLATHPKILILNGPTVGVDIGAKYDIHKLLRELAKQGMAVLVVSDDVAEITALCDRALIMKAGSMTGEFKGEDLTDDNLYKSTI